MDAQKRRIAVRGQDFQDRKLNCCAICKTKKQIAMQIADDGHVYFLCRGHAALDRILMGLFQYLDEHGILITEHKETPKEEPSYTAEQLSAMSRDVALRLCLARSSYDQVHR